jgi:enoyl-CoA hydratase
VSKLVPSGEALTQAVELVPQIATMPPLAVGEIAMRCAKTPTCRYFERLFDSEGQKEGMQAFLEKRPPVSGAVSGPQAGST